MVAISERPADVFAALADPLRRAILDGLRPGPQRMTDIAQSFPVSRQAVAKHLRTLERAGLVSVEREGRERHYQLEGQGLRAVDHWLAGYRCFWAGKLNSLKQHVEQKRATGKQHS